MKSKAVQTTIFLLSIISMLIAQPSFPSSPNQVPANQAPIGGLGLLAAAGGAMALKKLYDRQKK